MPIRMLLAALLALVLQAPTHAQDTSTNSEETVDAVYAYMTTSMGDILLELDRGKAPISVENFMKYAEDKAYDGTIFHRVIGNFMIQGGGFEPDMTKRETRDPIKNESPNGLKNARGTIAMARTNNPDSATNQFFINVKDNFNLDVASARTGGAAYAVFGKVDTGMETVDRIRAVPTTVKAPMRDVPVEPVVIESVTKVSPTELETARKRIEAREKELAAEAARAIEEQREKALALLEGKGVDTDNGTLHDSGLWTVVTKEGSGESPSPTNVVKVHYTGWFLNGESFDSSHERGTPAEFPLNGVIKGWTEGVGMMKPGETRYLVIPHELAYGAAGRPGIPPKSMLVFQVDLLEVVR